MKAVKQTTKDQFPRVYVEVLNGLFSLTEKEVGVIVAILQKRQELIDNGLSGKYLTKFLFNTETRKEIYTSLGLSYHGFNNYLNALIKKGIIIDNDGDYSLIKQIIPETKVEFEFKVI